MKKTKIVCTIGPASSGEDTLLKMIKSGMNVARLNMSHGTYEDHRKLIKSIRAAAKKAKEQVALLLDLQGPKIRVGSLPAEGVKLEEGKRVVFTTSVDKDGASLEAGKIPVTYLGFSRDVRVGSRLLLDDGLLEAVVVSVKGADIHADVLTGGVLTSHKGLNLPDVSVSIPALTDKDKADLRFGMSEEVDFVALSFVRTAKDVSELRSLIGSLQKKKDLPVRIIVKIEKHEAIKNFDEILEATDAVMVARGDLAVETSAEHVPLYQKEIIEKCRHKCKPVIVATQMLDSMIRNPRPTRAEVSDVANAVIDHADAVMLSGESATGKYPVEAVATMAKVIEETEGSRYDDVSMAAEIKEESKDRVAISAMAALLQRLTKANLILGASWSGETARMLAHYRPECFIAIGSPSERVVRQLNLSWGVKPFLLPSAKNADELIRQLLTYAKREKLASSGDRIILLSGESVGAGSHTTLVGLRRL